MLARVKCKWVFLFGEKTVACFLLLFIIIIIKNVLFEGRNYKITFRVEKILVVAT